MPEYDFSHPHRQSRIGLILIFLTAVFQLIRNLWVVIIYFLVRDINQQTFLLVLLGLLVILFFILVYSVFAFRNFTFHIDQRNREFVLQKGVFSSDTTNIPFDKIQQVRFKRNLLQRVIGVYSVVVETAGSQEQEIEIKALLEDKANALAERLMELKKEVPLDSSRPPEAEEKEQEPSEQWHYEVPLVTLIKLGLSSNYLRGVALILTFYFTLREQIFLREFFPAELSGQEIMAKTSFLFIIALLAVGMLITVAETVIKYFGLNLKQFKDSIEVEMGLRNNTKVNVRLGRVQMMEVRTNPVQQWLRLFGIKLSLASSKDELEKNRLTIPGLPPRVVDQVRAFFYKDTMESAVDIRPHKIVLWRKFSRGMIPAAVALVAGLFSQDLIPLRALGILLSVYLVLLSVYNFFYYKNLHLRLSQHVLIKYSGVWVKKQQYLEIYRLQAVSVRQPLWYKRKGIMNLTFHSAGGDLVFNGVKEEHVTPLVNYVLYSIESTRKSWM